MEDNTVRAGAESNVCPQCGTPQSPALAGFCPACLLQQGVADTGTGGHPPFVPPTVAELVPLFPQLEFGELIGKGGMGAVYKARQRALDRVVALKLLPARGAAAAAFPERFAREARALARLSHPNIITVHEFGTAGGYHYFVMEYVDGLNLRQLNKAGRIAPREALQIVPQICDALQYAHDQGIVHRDIKPENVLIDRQGRVKIADFGIAKLVDVPSADAHLTAEGQTVGTPHYMAPEQVERPRDVDHRADIFSLGVVFYELLTGELPIGKFAPPSRKVQLDVRLDDVVLRALEKEPERRYQKANDVRTAVETICSTPVAPARIRFDARARSRAAAVLAIGGILAAVLLIAFSSAGPSIPLFYSCVAVVLCGFALGISSWRTRLGKTVCIVIGCLFAALQIHGWYLDDRLPSFLTGRVPGSQPPGFGPVIERVLIDENTQTDKFAIDFDTGNLFTPPASREDWLGWARSTGVDAIASTGPNWKGLTALHLQGSGNMAPGVGTWNRISGAELRSLLARIEAGAQRGDGSYNWSPPERGLGANRELPETWIFQTLEGNVGILQVTEFRDRPRSMRIRYKLASPSPAGGGMAGATNGAPSFSDVLQFRWVTNAGDLSAELSADPISPKTKLHVSREILMDGSAMALAGWAYSQQPSNRQITVELTSDGAKNFELLTRNNIGRQIAIVARGQVISAPIIRSAIPGGRLVISGSFGSSNIHEIVDLLNRRAMPSERLHFDRAATVILPPLTGPGAAWFDLDTGRFATNASYRREERESQEWIRLSGVDMAVWGQLAIDDATNTRYFTNSPASIACLNTIVFELKDTAWETVTPADVVNSWDLMKGAPLPETQILAAPAPPGHRLFAFRTSNNGWGVFRILGVFSDRPGVNIEYKLVAVADVPELRR